MGLERLMGEEADLISPWGTWLSPTDGDAGDLGLVPCSKQKTHFSFDYLQRVSVSGSLLPETTHSVTQNMPVSGGLKSKVSSTDWSQGVSRSGSSYRLRDSLLASGSFCSPWLVTLSDSLLQLPCFHRGTS